MMGISATPTFAPPAAYSHCIPAPVSLLRPTTVKAPHRRAGVRCRSSSNGIPGPGSDENDNKVVLDAFFLGKAFAEALNERIGSTVGEVLSVVGQWQAEQQKEVQVFQEEVLERAKKAKEKAALEVKEKAGISKTSTTVPPVTTPRSGPASDDTFHEMLKD